MAIDVVRSTLLPVLEPYLECTVWRERDDAARDAKRLALGESLGAAIASLPLDAATFDALELFAATFLQVAAEPLRTFFDHSALAPTSVLSAWIEDLRYRVFPPTLAEGACDCELRELFHVLTPPPAEWLEPVSSTSEGEELRCRRCERRWWRDAHPRPFSWCRVRSVGTPAWDLRRTSRAWVFRGRWEGCCPCGHARFVGSEWLCGIPRTEDRKGGDAEWTCACGQVWLPTRSDERVRWRPSGTPAPAPSPPVAEPNRGPWHLLDAPARRSAATTLGKHLDDYLLVPVDLDVALERLPDLDRAIAAVYEALPAEEASLEVVDTLLHQFNPAVNAHLGTGKAQTPHLPWGIGLSLRMLRAGLHRRVLQARLGDAPCDCAVVQRIQEMGQPGPTSDRLVLLDENDRWTLHRCDHCGQGWRNVDKSTESSSWSCWEAESVSRGAPPLDLEARALQNAAREAAREADERRPAEDDRRPAEDDRKRPALTHEERRRAAAEAGRAEREADLRRREAEAPRALRGAPSRLVGAPPRRRVPDLALRDHLALRIACGLSGLLPVGGVFLVELARQPWGYAVIGLGIWLPGVLAGVLARKLNRWWFVWGPLCPFTAGIPALVLCIQPDAGD